MAREVGKQTSVIVTGNPVDGLFFYGPFDTTGEASEMADRHIHGNNNVGEYWIARLLSPRDLEA